MIPQSSKKNSITSSGVIAICGAYLFYFFYNLIRLSNNILYQVIEKQSLSPFKFSILVSTLQIVYGCMQLPAGFFQDIYGLKKTMTFLPLITGIGLILQSFFSHSFSMTFLSRILIGIGTCSASTGLVNIIVKSVATEKRKKYVYIIVNSCTLLGSIVIVFLNKNISIVLKHWNVFLFGLGLTCILISLSMLAMLKDSKLQEKISIADVKAEVFQRKNLNTSIISLILYSMIMFIPFYILFDGYIDKLVFLLGKSKVAFSSSILVLSISHSIGTVVFVLLSRFVSNSFLLTSLPLIMCPLSILAYYNYLNPYFFLPLLIIVGYSNKLQNAAQYDLISFFSAKNTGVVASLLNFLTMTSSGLLGNYSWSSYYRRSLSKIDLSNTHLHVLLLRKIFLLIFFISIFCFCLSLVYYFSRKKMPISKQS